MFATYCTPGGTATTEVPTGMNGQNRVAEMTGLHPSAYGLHSSLTGLPTNVAYNNMVGTPVVTNPMGWNPAQFGAINPALVGGIQQQPISYLNPMGLQNTVPFVNPFAAITAGIPTTTFGLPFVNPFTNPYAGLNTTPLGMNPFTALNPLATINPYATINPWATLQSQTMGVNPFQQINAIPVRVYIQTPTGVVPAVANVTTTINPVTGTPVTTITNVVPTFPVQHGPLGGNTINPYVNAYSNPFVGSTVNPFSAIQSLTNPLSTINPLSTVNPLSTISPFSAVHPYAQNNPFSGSFGYNTVNPLSTVNPWSISNPLSAINPAFGGTSPIGACGINPWDSLYNPYNALNTLRNWNTVGAFPQTTPFGIQNYGITNNPWNPIQSALNGSYVNPLASSLCGTQGFPAPAARSAVFDDRHVV